MTWGAVAAFFEGGRWAHGGGEDSEMDRVSRLTGIVPFLLDFQGFTNRRLSVDELGK